MTLGCISRGMIAAAGAAALGLAAPAAVWAADAPEWTVDAKESRITFTGRQMNAPTTGHFRRFTAKVRFDPANLGDSSVDVTIDAASADTGNKDIDGTLQTEKFFDVKRFPQARFIASGFRAKGGNQYEAVAKLTIRDVTKDVVLPFTLDVQDKGGQLVAKASGKLTISRLAFNIGAGEWKSPKVIADEVVIQIDVVASRKK